MFLFDPLSHALAMIVAAAYTCFTALGLDPSSGLTWTLSIAAVVVTVRVALLPAVAHGVRVAHASARARPDLTKLAERYRNRRDTESLRAFAEERRRIAAEHQLSTWGCLPALVQLPVWIALYHLVSEAAGGSPVGAVDATLVASLGAATVLGVPLAARGYLGAGPAHLAVIVVLAGTAALLSYVTQKFVIAPNLAVGTVPDVLAKTQQLMPMISAAGVLVAAAFVPAALLVYWVVNSSWTLTQSAAIARWYPTPGSAAAARAEARLETRRKRRVI